MRARLALAVSGTVCAVREVELKNKPAELIAVSPKATVPVIVDVDGTVIDQSLDIMRWALSRNDPEGWLWAGDAVEPLIARNDGPFKQVINRYKYPDSFPDFDLLQQRAEGMDFLADLDARLSGTRYLLGDRYSLADAAIFPFVRQFAAVDEGWFAAQPVPGLHRWLKEQMESPLFAVVMTKWKPWRTGEAEPLFLPIAPLPQS